MEETREQIAEQLEQARQKLREIKSKLDEFDKEERTLKFNSAIGKCYKNIDYSKTVSGKYQSVYLHRVDDLGYGGSYLTSTSIVAYKYLDNSGENSAEISIGKSFSPFNEYQDDDHIEIDVSEFNEWLNFSLEELKIRNEKNL